MNISKAIGLTKTALEFAAIRILSKQAGNLHIARKLSQLPGVPAKIGQVVAMKNGFELPKQDFPQTMPVDYVLSIIQKKLPNLFKVIEEFDDKPFVASLSQVHKAKLSDGRAVVIKVQYPDLDSEIDEQLKLIFNMFTRYGPGQGLSKHDVDNSEENFRRSLKAELDYTLEASNQKKFRDLHLHNSKVIVPEVLSEYSCNDILTQTYEPSDSVERLKELSSHDREEIAEAFSEFFIRSVFRDGFVHGDLNPGNWGYRVGQKRIVFYDFGAMISITSEHIATLRSLVESPEGLSSEFYYNSYTKLGFDPHKLTHLIQELPELTAILFEPLRHAGEFGSWNLAARIESLLLKKKWDFRLSGPPWFLNLIRASQGFLHAIHKLEARPRLSEVYSTVTGYSSTSFSPLRHTDVLSRNLKIEITEGGEQVVYLEFPAHSSAHLNELISDDVKMKIESQGKNISEIEAAIVASNFAPQILFETMTFARKFRVWLE